jgi:hypothetical protein
MVIMGTRKGPRPFNVAEATVQIATSLDRFMPEQLAVNRFRLLSIELEHVLGVADTASSSS